MSKWNPNTSFSKNFENARKDIDPNFHLEKKQGPEFIHPEFGNKIVRPTPIYPMPMGTPDTRHLLEPNFKLNFEQINFGQSNFGQTNEPFDRPRDPIGRKLEEDERINSFPKFELNKK